MPTDSIDILLVEDNPGDARLLREAFETTTRETTLHTVTDGETALEFLLRRGDHEDASRPDLVFLDLNLPGADGCDVLRAIRDEPGLETLPVIVLTSSDADDDIARCYGADANAYLTKPANPDELFSLVETVERFWFEQVRLPPATT